MENFRLKVFRTVAAKHSFRHAAEALYLTQPAVTLQVKALEDELGLKLFDRSGKTITLTTAGDRLLKYAEEISAMVQAAREALLQLKGPDHGELKVGASTTIAQYVLPKIFGEFVAHEPEIHISIVSGNNDKIVHDVLEGEIALGLIEGPARQPLLKTEFFLADEIAIIVPAGHPWADKTITLEELRSAPLIVREDGSGTRRVVENTLRDAGVHMKDLNFVMQLDSTEAIKASVEAGLGVGFVSRRAIRKEITLNTLKEVAVDSLRFWRDFAILYPRGPEPSGAAGTFLLFLRSVRDRYANLAEQKD
jgi:LysR family transcriptional regulator, transcriptional activator of the cysJI operon